jgi:hypothetical protein
LADLIGPVGRTYDASRLRTYERRRKSKPFSTMKNNIPDDGFKTIQENFSLFPPPGFF